VGTIALGLLVHLHGQGVLRPIERDVVGDLLYAVMIVWWVGAVAPRSSVWLRGLVALLFCFAIELSQLYHGPGVDALRATLLGHLVLGSSFDWRDLGVYTAGAVAAVWGEQVVRPRAKTHGRDG